MRCKKRFQGNDELEVRHIRINFETPFAEPFAALLPTSISTFEMSKETKPKILIEVLNKITQT